jgi:hypothetical protein
MVHQYGSQVFGGFAPELAVQCARPPVYVSESCRSESGWYPPSLLWLLTHFIFVHRVPSVCSCCIAEDGAHGHGDAVLN